MFLERGLDGAPQGIYQKPEGAGVETGWFIAHEIAFVPKICGQCIDVLHTEFKDLFRAMSSGAMPQNLPLNSTAVIDRRKIANQRVAVR